MVNKESQSISLKILVETEKQRVVFAEADGGFIDVLFSFMTMPLGTITRLTREKSLKGEIGCLNNLYQSVENLAEEILQNTDCKDMVLNPRSAAELYHRNLRLDWIECNIGKYYACCSVECNFLSCYQNVHCRCGTSLGLEVEILNPTIVPQEGGVFVKPRACLMVRDDFQVVPMSTMTGITLLDEVGAIDGGNIEERTVSIGKDEVLQLLKCSLTSKTPFTDALIEAPTSKPAYLVHCGQCGSRSMNQVNEARETEKKGISFKLIFDKSKSKVLYAEVEEDFVSLLCSFLTIPLGFVFKNFQSSNFRGCIGNLYRSIQDFNVDKYFKSVEMKETLVNPKLAPGLAQDGQLMGIEEASNPSYSHLTSVFRTEISKLNSDTSEVKAGKGFVKELFTFMVEDNLTVTPLSPISGITLAKKLNIPLRDIGEKEVTMCEDQALQLLAAALDSRYALTDVFMLQKPKQETVGLNYW